MNEQQMVGVEGFAPIIMMVLLLVVFYFILIRPQKKKEKKLREMIAALRVGDEVASIGGIHGKIARIKDDIFILETGVGTMKSFISIERSAISRLIKEGKNKEEDVAPLADEPESATDGAADTE